MSLKNFAQSSQTTPLSRTTKILNGVLIFGMMLSISGFLLNFYMFFNQFQNSGIKAIAIVQGSLTISMFVAGAVGAYKRLRFAYWIFPICLIWTLLGSCGRTPDKFGGATATMIALLIYGFFAIVSWILYAKLFPEKE